MYAKKILYLEIPRQNSFSSIGSDKTWNPTTGAKFYTKKSSYTGHKRYQIPFDIVLEKKG
ncbi:hypothetical protein GCM10023142_12010 [Anaerocolumna aminovalerica]|uniref:hypothetical protein n=1 Tax=Anaerocolumna aminovalerica TaxID=1527 RepID=UPI0011143876|nr:hypothetical protein [Anaerocolumna aminovalerica]